MSSGLGIAIGPLGGGLLLEHFWWGSVFLVNVAHLRRRDRRSGLFFVPDSRDPDEDAARPDRRCSRSSRSGLIMFGIIEAPDLGWGDPQVDRR